MLVYSNKKPKVQIFSTSESKSTMAVMIGVSVILSLLFIVGYSSMTHTEVDSHPILSICLTTFILLALIFFTREKNDEK
jgi:protein-S-isoprenylcysteine O-methyltransferase Ste14